MSGVYPYFKPSHTQEELVEHFLLTPADLQLVKCLEPVGTLILNESQLLDSLPPSQLSRRQRLSSSTQRALWRRTAKIDRCGTSTTIAGAVPAIIE
jgi:hypothetical protein